MSRIQDGDPVRFVRCTSSEYQSIENKDPSTIYFILPDDSLLNSDTKLEDDDE